MQEKEEKENAGNIGMQGGSVLQVAKESENVGKRRKGKGQCKKYWDARWECIASCKRK